MGRLQTSSSLIHQRDISALQSMDLVSISLSNHNKHNFLFRRDIFRPQSAEGGGCGNVTDKQAHTAWNLLMMMTFRNKGNSNSEIKAWKSKLGCCILNESTLQNASTFQSVSLTGEIIWLNLTNKIKQTYLLLKYDTPSGLGLKCYKTGALFIDFFSNTLNFRQNLKQKDQFYVKIDKYHGRCTSCKSAMYFFFMIAILTLMVHSCGLSNMPIYQQIISSMSAQLT